MYPPIYVISLDTPSGRKRLRRMRSHLGDLGIPFTVHKGVHGATLSPDGVKAVATRACGIMCTPSTIGCGASHAAVWKRVLESGVPYAIVLEDDTELVPDTVRQIRHIVPRMPPETDVLVLGCFMCGTSSRPIAPEEQRLERLTHFFGTHAYLVTRQGAAKLLAHAYPVKYHLDMTMTVLSRTGHIVTYGLTSDIASQAGGEDTSQNISVEVPGFPNLLYTAAKGVRDSKGQSLYFYMSMPIARVGSYAHHVSINAVDLIVLSLGAFGVPFWVFAVLVIVDAIASYRVRGVTKAVVLWAIGNRIGRLMTGL